MKVFKFVYYEKHPINNKVAKLKANGWSFGIDISETHIFTVSRSTVGSTLRSIFDVGPPNKNWTIDMEKVNFEDVPKEYIYKIFIYVLEDYLNVGRK